MRCTDHSCWQSGHLLFCFTHRLMQQWWKEWLHSPQTTTQSWRPPPRSVLFSAWHRRQASITWTRQIAQVSHSTSQLHIATAFHFFSVNIFSGFVVSASPLSDTYSTSSAMLKAAHHLWTQVKIEIETEKMSRDDNVDWFHGRISREDAENILKEHLTENPEGSEGLFLVRDSSTARGDYVLSVIHDSEVVHYQIRKRGEDAFFSIDEESIIHGLDTLIEHYQQSSHGLVAKLERHVKKSPPPPDSRRHGRTNLLHRATKEGNFMVVRELLQCGYRSIDAKNQDGKTAVHFASELGLDDILTKLIDAGANVNARDTAGYMPLHYAAKMNKPSTICVLIDQGAANPQARNPETGWVPLHEAASRGHAECVKALLALNAPCKPRTPNNETPAVLALRAGHYDCHKILEDYHSPPAKSNKDDWFHGVLDRSEAHARLQAIGENGAFLVRNSPRKPGMNVLTMIFAGHVYNYEIRKQDRNYFIDDGPFLESLEHVISHYSMMSDGLPINLCFPVRDCSHLPIPNGTRNNLDVTRQTFPRKSSPNEKRLPLPPLPLPRKLTPPRIPPLSKEADQPPLQGEMNIEPYPKDDIPKSALVLGKVLGEGDFGAVYLAFYTEPDGSKRDVAVKTLQVDLMQSSKDEFIQEAQVMMQLEHHCIVKLIGICKGPPFLMVQELVLLGSLLDFLISQPQKVNPVSDFSLWGAQICCGMLYLETKRFVHRDLAARNILMASKNQVKISDFGLSRALGSGEYYRASKGGRWPLKWYAPESVNFGTFSHASDVWSFGVTLWEMYSFGQQPYGDMKGAEVAELIERGERLLQPVQCPESVYKVMETCWKYRPENRPTFKELYEIFTSDREYANLKDLILEMDIS